MPVKLFDLTVTERALKPSSDISGTSQCTVVIT